MNQKEILDAIKAARAGSKERKFKQTVDLAVNFKDLDFKNPSHKFKESIILPHGRGKAIKVAAFADGVVAEAAKKAGIKTILEKSELSKLATDKKAGRQVINKFDFFIAQTDYMVEVGKRLGAVLGPRNKMPQPVPPNVPLEPMIKRFEKLVNVRIINLPVIHCRVGTEEMSDDQLLANISAVLTALARKAPKGEANIKSVYVKTTMGPSVKIGGIEKVSKSGAPGRRGVEKKVEGGEVEGSEAPESGAPETGAPKENLKTREPENPEPVEPAEGGEEQ